MNKEWDGDYPVQIKRPLVAILMADGYKKSVIEGEKQITIRMGWRDYKVGDDVIICNPEFGFVDGHNWSVKGKITYVMHCMLKGVDKKDLLDDKFESLEMAIKTLSSFYKEVSPDSLVTVIRWELV